MSVEQRSRNNRRPSRASKYHQQYLSFLRKWKSYVHSQEYTECERLCLDHIDRIDRSIRFQIKQYGERHGGAHLDYNDSRFYDIKNYRSKVRNLYAVLLHDYRKQHNDALEQYELCVEDDEYNASAHYNWAILYKNFYKDYESAQVHYRKAIELKPNHAAYHNNYGLLLEQQLKKYDLAKKQFGIALSLDDKNGRAHTNMANLLKKHYKDYETAKIHYEKAINLDPQNPTRHFNYALFLKHNLNDYTLAANEYEKAINLDNGYYQAHNEYKNFLLTEIPSKNNTLLIAHTHRCIKYAITLLWNKKIKDAKEIIIMANKCSNNNNYIAQLMLDPYNTTIEAQNMGNMSVADDNDSEWIIQQKENELYNLHSKMNRFHRRLSNITSSLKKFHHASPNHANEESLTNDSGTPSSIPQPNPSGITPFTPQQIIYDNEVSQSVINDIIVNDRPGNLYREDSQSQWRVDDLQNLTHEMGAEIQRLNMLSQHGYNPMSDDETTENNSKLNPTNHINKLQPNNPNPPRFGNGKRGSLISVNSATDFNQKYTDMHKQTLFSAAKIIENIMSESNVHTQYKKKLDDVMDMIIQTARVWDYIDFEDQGMPHEPVGRLTQNNIINHNNDKGGGADMLAPDDGMYEAARTLGGMSMVSHTSSAVLEQRNTFLRKAAANKNVRKGDRIVAKYLAQTFLSTRTDTPQSVLSQSQLPFFSDEEDNDSLDEAINEKMNANNGSFKGQTMEFGTSEIRCEQRVKRWRQQPKLQQHLSKINEWDFDIFYVVENAGNYAMPALGITLLENRGLIGEFGLNPTHICNYFHQISLSYKNNPYHNSFHGCDVLVNCNYFLNAKLMRNIRKIDQFACLVAGATHDVGHPGNNNGFEIAKESDLAVTYNDVSVLESYHIALAWQILKRPGCNILHTLSKPQRKEFRKLLIDCILNTDMSHHAAQQKLLAELIDCVTNSGIDLERLEHSDLDNSDAKSIVSISNIPPNSIYADPAKFAKVVIPLAVHTADLSNPSKDIKLYGQWAKRVVQEFFNQADSERKQGLPVSAFMDKSQTDLPTIQCGFVNHVIRPWFDLWGRLLRDKSQGPLYQFNVNSNLKFMQNELAKLKKARAEQKKSELASMQKMKQRYTDNTGTDGNESEGTLSVVDMTFEDMSKAEMRDRMQKFEELKSRQKEYYEEVNQQIEDLNHNQNNINNINYESNTNESPPKRKKKMLYSGYDHSSNHEQNGNSNGKKASKSKNHKKNHRKQRKNSRDNGLTTIAEV